MEIKTTKEMITDLISICKDNSCNLKDLLTTINISKEDKRWVVIDDILSVLDNTHPEEVTEKLRKSLSTKNNKNKSDKTTSEDKR